MEKVSLHGCDEIQPILETYWDYNMWCFCSNKSYGMHCICTKYVTKVLIKRIEISALGVCVLKAGYIDVISKP